MSEKPKENPSKETETEVTEGGQKKVVHKVEVSMDEELKKTRDELALTKKAMEDEKKRLEDEKTAILKEKENTDTKLKEKEAIRQKQALEAFDKEKTDLLEICKTSKLAEENIAMIEERLQDPKQLETVKALVKMLIPVMQKPTESEETPPKKPPQGKAPFIAPAGAEQYESGVEAINAVYKVLRDTTGKYTKEQKAEAQTKREMLVKNFIMGKSADQLKRGASLGPFSIMECPQCGKVITGKVPANCQCGFDFTKTGDREPIKGK